jgi:hypothetical protein
METFRDYPALGYGTYKYAGTPNTVGGTTLEALLAAAGLSAIPADVSGFDLYIVSAASAVYFENDGTAASVDSLPIDAPGPAMRFRNAKYPMNNGHYKFFSAGAVDFRIALWG